MAKVAKLVTISLVTRVVVEHDAPESHILDIARYKFMDQIRNELDENVESIQPDNECPFGTQTKDYGCSCHR